MTSAQVSQVEPTNATILCDLQVGPRAADQPAPRPPLILAPDWGPVTCTAAERNRGQARSLKTIETFQAHGTPPVEAG